MGQLIYESTCRMCAPLARWTEQQAAGAVELVPFGDPRVPQALDADRSQIHYIEGGVVWHGGAAMTRALRHSRRWRFTAITDRAPLSWFRDVGYRIGAVVHAPIFRHRLKR